MISRVYNNLYELLPENKVLIIYGPRRVGKTTLIKLLLKDVSIKYKIDSGDNITVRNTLNSQDFKLIKEYASGYDLLIIDEAQNIEGIGMGLKIMVDQIPELKIIATGSSSFNLEQKIGEPLTGRKKVCVLYPLAQLELNNYLNHYELKENLEQFLIYGSYPEVYTSNSNRERKEILHELVNSYLLKDVLGFNQLKSPGELIDLLKLLAFQVGHEVSVHELAKNIRLNVRTIERYLYLLEKGFVIYKLNAFSKNPRIEISKKSKYYFYDNGIRNGIIMQFNDINSRNDVGQLWENFIVTERLKYLHYKRHLINRYFWRSYTQKEVDYLEETDNNLYAYEIKWSKKMSRLPAEFLNNYTIKDFMTISFENYLNFVL